MLPNSMLFFTPQMVTRYLGIDCSVLMGANIAIDIAREEVRSAMLLPRS